MSQPAQCNVENNCVATLQPQKGDTFECLRVWGWLKLGKEAQIKTNESVSTRCHNGVLLCVMQRFYTQRIIYAKTQTWPATAGRLEQLQDRDCSHTSSLITSDNLGVSQHTLGSSTASEPRLHTLATCTYSLSFTEHYSFKAMLYKS